MQCNEKNLKKGEFQKNKTEYHTVLMSLINRIAVLFSKLSVAFPSRLKNNKDMQKQAKRPFIYKSCKNLKISKLQFQKKRLIY